MKKFFQCFSKQSVPMKQFNGTLLLFRRFFNSLLGIDIELLQQDDKPEYFLNFPSRRLFEKLSRGGDRHGEKDSFYQ